MACAGAIDGLSEPAYRALLHAAPSSVVCKVAWRALIDTSRSSIVSVLVPTAVEHALRIENISISELSG